MNQYGFVNVSEVMGSIKPNTVLISIMLANNETGVIQVKLKKNNHNFPKSFTKCDTFKPIKELGHELKKLCYKKERNQDNRHCSLFLHTDAAQAIGKIKVDVANLQVDYLSIVGHKVTI